MKNTVKHNEVYIDGLTLLSLFQCKFTEESAIVHERDMMIIATSINIHH